MGRHNATIWDIAPEPAAFFGGRQDAMSHIVCYVEGEAGSVTPLRLVLLVPAAFLRSKMQGRAKLQGRDGARALKRWTVWFRN
jgi:hypothetical protein